MPWRQTHECRGAAMRVERAAMRMLSITLLVALAGCVSSTQNSVSSNDEAAGFNVQLGLGYLQQGNLVVAKEKLERAERESPRDPKVHNAMGLLYALSLIHIWRCRRIER